MATIKFSTKLIQIGGGRQSVYLRIPNALAFNVLNLSPGQGATLTVNPDRPGNLAVVFGAAKKKQKST